MRRDGKAHHPLLLLSFLAVLVLPSHAQSNSSRPGTDDNRNYCSSNGDSVYPCLGFTCSADRSIYPCRAYALYRASTGDNLTSVADLFGVSRLSIARASNLSANSTDGLRSGQPLLIPLLCSCAENHSYALVDYQINAGDTYYIISTTKLQNLTVFPAVELVNPTLVPTDLTIGVITVFPIFCQCPNRTNLLINTNTSTNLDIISYVFQPSDSYSSIASEFGTDVQSLISLNGPERLIEAFSVILIPVTQMPPPLLANTSSAPSPSSTPPASSTVVEKKDRKGVIAGLAAGMGLFAILLLLVLVLYLGERKKGGREGAKADAGGGNKKGSGGRAFGWSGTDEMLMADISGWLDKYKVYQIEELRLATSDFDYTCLIQGSVYKGIIDGEVFAVKKMKWNACEELKILQKVFR